jgi:hypothetical protein
VIDSVHLLLKARVIIRTVTDDSVGCVGHSVRPQGLTNDVLQGLARDSSAQTTRVCESPQWQVGLSVQHERRTRVNVQQHISCSTVASEISDKQTIPRR